MSETKYLNFEMIIMDTKILKKELIKEIHKRGRDDAYIEEILTYGAWGWEIEGNSTLEKAYILLYREGSLCSLQKDLFSFVYSSCPALIKILMEETYIDPNLKNYWGETALHVSSRWSKSPQVVEALLTHPKINPNLKDKDGFPPLMRASEKGHSQVVQALLSHPKTDPNLKNRWSGENALMEASRDGHLQVVQALLSHPKTDPNGQCLIGNTALHLVSPYGQTKKEVTLELLKHPKINPNLQNSDGYTALHYASLWGRSQVVQALLSHPKTDKTITDNKGQTAWDRAKPEIREQFPQLKP